MNPGNDSPDNSLDEAAGLGPPIEVLRTQEDIPSSDFIDKVRRKIYRRATAAQLASYSWQVPKLVLLEAVNLFGHVVRSFSSQKEPPR